MIRNILFLRRIVQKGYLGLHHVESSYQVCRCLLNKRQFSQNLDPPEWHRNIQLPDPELDFDYLVDDKNTKEIEENIQNRKGDSDIHKVKALWKKYQEETETKNKDTLWRKLLEEALKVPNSTNPNSPIGSEEEATVVEIIGKEKDVIKKKNMKANEIAEELRLLSQNYIVSGERTLHFYGNLAKLEQALIKYTLSKILSRGFTLLTVPDMLHPAIIERCGFPTTGIRNQVFKLNSKYHGDICFAGTAEMPLAGYFMNEVFSLDELPKRVCAVSRCFRAEVSYKGKEKGLYRTKIFTKVEMFGLTANETGHESNDLLLEILEIQKELFQSLGLVIRVLDMPTHELGAPAHRKFDIETLLERSKFWGEISSASDCTDYQSRRLNIKYRNKQGDLKHVSTVNGTACAIPRMVMGILERWYSEEGSQVLIPPVLLPYMDIEEDQTHLLPLDKHYNLNKQCKLTI